MSNPAPFRLARALRRMGVRHAWARLGLVAALLAAPGCQGAAGRAQLLTAPVDPTAVAQLDERETHGESHPNAVGAFLEGLGGGLTLQATEAAPAAKILPGHELLVTDPKVVDDPVRATGQGAWAFGTLMTRLAGKQAPAAFAMDWLTTWERQQRINGEVSAARPAIRQTIIAPWLKASGGKQLDLAKAPFRLLAIVNRVDLRKAGDAGEGRLVFGAVDASGFSLPFTVIFEYGIPLAKVGSAQAWARKWHALAGQPLGSAAYNQALQGLTDTFTAAGADPRRPNGSALYQLRTNENALNFLWELREFQISAKTGKLAQVTVKQSPRQALAGSKQLADFLKANAPAVLAGKHVVPPAMLGAGSDGSVTWTAPGVDEKVRKAFAVATCIGCHAGETGTAFLHVGTREKGQAAGLSSFVTRTELPARARDLASLLGTRSGADAPVPGEE